MNKLSWAAHVLITIALGLFGAQKVLMPLPDLIAQGMLWIEDFPAWQVRTIGALEVLGVVGLNLPYAVKAIPRLLVSVSAACLSLTMLGAVFTHALRGDPPASMVLTSVLAAACALVAVKRWGQQQTRV